MKDGIPFVTRSISFYFIIPGTSVVIQVLGEHNYYWTTPIAFCRQTGDETTRLLPRYSFFFKREKYISFEISTSDLNLLLKKILLTGLVQLRIGFGDLGLEKCSHCAILMKLGV